MLQFIVDEAKCTRCGQCVCDCPSRIIEQTAGAVPFIRPANEARCIQCQHCLAVCPPAAVSIFGHDPAHSRPLTAGSFPDLEQMLTLVRGRRSVRRYCDENVDPALLQRLLAALANVPSGVNRRALTFSVIDDKTVMRQFRLRALNGLAAAEKAGRVPAQFAYLIPAVPAWFEQGVDMIFRGAPHLLVVSAGPEAVCPEEDVNLALACFDLMAQSAGLGTVWCGMAKMALELLPDLKASMGLQPGHFYYAMLFGLPSFRYARTVQRDAAAHVHRVSA
ncbi:MAG: nitroreductase family protein [Kiritimatiellaeota bacterium]|nr:nitroreductase family protein [Kiritimatiellota bacterium]